MAKPSTPMLIPKRSQDAMVQYLSSCCSLTGAHWNMRSRMEDVDRAYQREVDATTEQARAQLANRKLRDATKLQNVVVPVVMPLVESAVTYQASVFLTGTPLFSVVANPANMDAALQMDTIIEDQSIHGGWVRELILFLRDGFKYNFSAIEVPWVEQTVAELETDLGFSTSQARPKEVTWAGNAIKRLDPYNLIYDPRVAPAEIHARGEFAGYVKVMSRIELKGFIAGLPDKLVDNVNAAFASQIGATGTSAFSSSLGYYTPQINNESFSDRGLRSGHNWLAWAELAGAEQRIQYRDSYEVTTLYARILPSDFNLNVPSRHTPQVWKFIFVNGTVLLYAERQTNAHSYIPILFGQPLEDGLDYQTKPLADNVLPIQETASALWNSAIAARRRAISDRGLYDPTRVAEHHINNPSPTAKIPVRPNSYGKPLSEAYFPIPFRDDQSGVALSETQQLMQFANMITGQNPVRQGQFVKGNKTRHEFDSVMTNANGRDQLVSMLLEAQIFTPLKEILKTNILQYQGAGSLFNRELERQVDVDPIKLREAVLSFKVSDGLTPADKLINADVLQVAMQVVGSSPEIAAGYNVTPMFSYFIKTQGGRIREFEKSPEQVAYEQALSAWRQQMTLLAESMKRLESPAQIEELLKTVPPAPSPEQFGYSPGNKTAAGTQGAQ